MGFTVFHGDRCVFSRGVGKECIRLCTWVDDILALGRDYALDLFKLELEKVYELKEQKGRRLSYLSMDILRDPWTNDYLVAQGGARIDILANHGMHAKKAKKTSTPAAQNFFERDDNATDYVDAKMYLSILMSLMWIARLTRPDLLFVVTYLASFNKPTQQDYLKLCRVLSYLDTVGNVALRFKRKGLNFSVECDAAHNVHRDHKGHGGLSMKLGSAVIHSRSVKLKTVTLDTAESEGYMMCESAKYIVWERELLKFLGHIITTATKLYQDNLSAIWHSKHDAKFDRNKHTSLKRAFVREKYDEQLMVGTYMEREGLASDILTHPSTKKDLQKHGLAMGLVSVPDSLGELLEKWEEEQKKKSKRT